LLHGASEVSSSEVTSGRYRCTVPTPARGYARKWDL